MGQNCVAYALAERTQHLPFSHIDHLDASGPEGS